VSGELPPPPLGSTWNTWAESLNKFLTRTRDQLRSLTSGDSAAVDGILMWDRSIEHPVVSLDGEWVPLGYGANEPDQGFGYGAFLDFENQTVAAVNTATAIKFDTTAYSENIYVASDGTNLTRITFVEAGKYYIHFTAQLNSPSASAKTFWFWPRINGTDITGSTMRITLHDQDEAKTVARAAIFEVDAGDYLEAMWAVDNTSVTLKAYAAETFCPAVPSVTLMVKSI
jgi:hypothetical protein